MTPAIGMEFFSDACEFQDFCQDRGYESSGDDSSISCLSPMPRQAGEGKVCTLGDIIMPEWDAFSRQPTPSTVADEEELQDRSGGACKCGIEAETCKLWSLSSRDNSPDDHQEESPLYSSAASTSHLELWHQPDETLILFDFDDTLCPSHHSRVHPDCKALSGPFGPALARHEAAVTRLLQAATDRGHVQIVTMAQNSWVERCITDLMPGLRDTLSNLRIPIVSARADLTNQDLRQANGDGRDPSHFLKTRTMKRVIKKFYGSGEHHRSWKNILSIGDSEAERCALQDIVFRHTQKDRNGVWKDCRCKTLLLRDKPTLEELTAELEFVAQLLPALVLHDGDLDMDIDEEDLQAAMATRVGA